MSNAKDPLYKEYLKTLERINELGDIRRNSGWAKLEKPIRRGYCMSFDLRDDIKNREDAGVFYTCLDIINNSTWCRDKKFLIKERKGKYVNYVPCKRYINRDIYEGLHPSVKKYFYKVENDFGRIQYHCSLSFELVYIIKPHYITEYRVIDEVIAQEEEELNRKLLYKFYKFEYTWLNNTGSYSIIRNRKDRAYNRAALNKNIKFVDFDKCEYRYQHKHSGKWDAW